MKITPITIAKAALILTTLSLASCGTVKYGCDYGAIPTKNKDSQLEEIKSLLAEEILTTYCYVKSKDI